MAHAPMFTEPEEFVPAATETPEEYTEPSRALIACNNGTGVVLEHIGHSLYCEIDAVGVYLSDLGLDIAPDGLSIWTGTYRGHPVCCGPDGVEYESFPEGEFRRLTPEELARMNAGEPVLIYE